MRSVNPDIYTQEYYLTDCSGFSEFAKSSGKSLAPRFLELLSYLKIKPDMRVLDIGCGRGELSFWAAARGAQVVAIDYSPAGIRLAGEALKKLPKAVQKNVTLKLQNAKELDFPPESFDLVLLIDVVEHLYREEQDRVFSKIASLLKREGELLVHTEPNRLYVDFSYPYWCYPVGSLLYALRKMIGGKRDWQLPRPKSLRTISHKSMHVAEPTYLGLRSVCKAAGLSAKIVSKTTHLRSNLGWKDRLFNFLVFAYPLSRFAPLSFLFANDFIMVARRNT
jgi:2-polyprenyl-3-methyl-5-hydroxy-6-metoxy-1,4-benzoquinol methylase